MRREIRKPNDFAQKRSDDSFNPIFCWWTLVMAKISRADFLTWNWREETERPSSGRSTYVEVRRGRLARLYAINR